MNPDLVLRQLLIEGYEGAALLAAFRRWWAALGADAAEQGTSTGNSDRSVTIDRTESDTATSKPNTVEQTSNEEPVPSVSWGLEAPARSLNTEVAIARKALNLVPRLSGGARQVGGAIIDHFNRRTGQCDPSVGRLAGKLALSPRTVLRKLEELQAAGLIRRVRHGGKSHRNAYLPDWAAFAEIVAHWEAPSANLSPSGQQRQDCHIEGDSPVTQTHVRNPDSRLSGGGHKERPPPKPKRPDPRQREMLMPLGPPSSATVALEAAKGRVGAAVRQHLSARGKSVFVAVYPEIPQTTWDAAYAAERYRRGHGLGVVLDWLRTAGRDIGPPLRATA